MRHAWAEDNQGSQQEGPHGHAPGPRFQTHSAGSPEERVHAKIARPVSQRFSQKFKQAPKGKLPRP
jgi:hypothetical protein